jgi:hypothetical protein
MHTAQWAVDEREEDHELNPTLHASTRHHQGQFPIAMSKTFQMRNATGRRRNTSSAPTLRSFLAVRPDGSRALAPAAARIWSRSYIFRSTDTLAVENRA